MQEQENKNIVVEMAKRKAKSLAMKKLKLWLGSIVVPSLGTIILISIAFIAITRGATMVSDAFNDSKQSGVSENTETENFKIWAENLSEDELKSLQDRGSPLNPELIPDYADIEIRSTPKNVPATKTIITEKNGNRDVKKEKITLDVEDIVEPYKLDWKLIAGLEIVNPNHNVWEGKNEKYLADIESNLKPKFSFLTNKNTKDTITTIKHYEEVLNDKGEVELKVTKEKITEKMPLAHLEYVKGVFTNYNFTYNYDVKTNETDWKKSKVQTKTGTYQEEGYWETVKGGTEKVYVEPVYGKETRRIKVKDGYWIFAPNEFGIWQRIWIDPVYETKTVTVVKEKGYYKTVDLPDEKKWVEGEIKEVKLKKWTETKEIIIEDKVAEVLEEPNFERIKSTFDDNKLATTDIILLREIINNLPNSSGIVTELSKAMEIADIEEFKNINFEQSTGSGNGSVIGGGSGEIVEGNPSGKGFMFPVPDYNKVTSPFGYRTHPIYGTQRLHTGVDLAYAGKRVGERVIAAKDGIVTRSGWGGGYGLVIYLKHDGKYTTRYAHNSKLLVKVGERVKQGQVIARGGTTGNSTGPHLHFEIRINGQPVNPLPYIR
ncbi:M23 family metallopeptidase [Senegalia massiliensis]|uniref:M23 family metallopeptidase n=1 Tax=Senegalia massiliensis TaxID=1720316 RepID=A0A845R1J9_9CLOT|nr:M23 family metallopeptidase [Senegalia massiliensis]NBI07596.1 M23 family metallopeptidase [Senegalia massiliensis]